MLAATTYGARLKWLPRPAERVRTADHERVALVAREAAREQIVLLSRNHAVDRWKVYYTPRQLPHCRGSDRIPPQA